MLKVHTERERRGQEHVTTLVLAGRLAGPWVQEVRRCWALAASADGTRCCVDLRDISYIDADGRALLAEMFDQGVELRASGCLTEAIVESLRVGRCQ